MPTKEERQKIKEAVRMVDPETVAQKIGLTKTKHGWVCPECNNGDGRDKTGIDPKYLSQNGDHVEWHCYKCGCSWDNIALVAKFKLNYKVNDKGNFYDANDFPKALDEVAKLLGVSIGTDGTVHSPNAAKPEIFDDADDDVDESKLKDYSNFYSFAAGGLKFFMNRNDGEYRGIPKVVYEYFWCGYVSEFGKAKTPAFIVPASKYSFLARFTGNEDELTDEQKQVLRPKWHSPVSKPVFNFKRAVESDDPIIFLHEGEFDAMSTFFGSVWDDFINANGIISLSKTPHVNTVAIMGTSITGKYKKRLRAEDIGKKFFVVLLDNDEAGIKKTPQVVNDLKALGHDAIGVRLSEKYNDANEFLQADPNKFAARIKEIYDAAKNGTLTDDEIFSTPADDEQPENDASQAREGVERGVCDIPIDMQNKITAWEKTNGVFNKKFLPTFFAETERVENAELTPELINDQHTQNFLGACLYYSFLADVHAKFFNRLRDAKAAAKAKVKAWQKNQNSEPEPTDNEKYLASLNVQDIENKVKTRQTAAKKIHKNFLEYVREQEIAEKAAAAKREYEEHTPTTKKFVPDCPVDLILPEGIYFSNDGIQIIDFDKPANKDGTRIPVTACENPIVPTKIFREPEKHITQYEVAIKTGNYWRHVVFDGQALQSPRAVDTLGNFGAHISDNRMMAKFFSKTIALNERLQKLHEVKTYKQPGWVDDSYTEFIWPTGGEDYIVDRKDFNYKKIFTPKGDMANWQKMFVEAINTGGAAARIFVGTALFAPLIRPLSSPNLQTHLYGLSGKGKTAIEKLTASIYGNPRELLATFGSTNKNRQLVASAFSDLPTFIDEMETTTSKAAENTLATTIYEYSLNKSNQANKRDGTAREPFYFYGTRLYTGERPLLKNHDQQGAFKRLLQLECENLYPDSFAAKMHVFSDSNYGHFGRKWIDFITANLGEIRKQYDTYAVAFPVAYKAYEPTLIKAIVAASIAMQFFKILLGEQDKFDEIAFEDDAIAIIKTLPTLKELSTGERALAELRSFVDGHPKYFVRERQNSEDKTIYEDTADANETYGKIFYSGEVAIYPAALRKILTKELGFASAEEILVQWGAKGSVLIAPNDRKYQHKIKVSGSSKWTFHFNANVLAEHYEENSFVPPPEYDDEYDYAEAN